MEIASLCRREVVTVPASASARDAAAAMRNQHVGALVVTDPAMPGRVVGVVTDRDLVVDLLALGHSADQPVGPLCRSEPVAVPAAASVAEAVQAMRRAGVRRLLVRDGHDAVVGLLSSDDLIAAVAGELDALAATLRDGVLAEGTRERARVRAESEAPRPQYAVSHEP